MRRFLFAVIVLFTVISLAGIVQNTESSLQAAGYRLSSDGACHRGSTGARHGDLYLYTYDQEQFYSRHRWSVLERTEYQGKQVAIMARKLAF